MHETPRVDKPAAPEIEANRRLWDRWTELHRESPFYDLDRFLGGGTSLTEMDLAEVGPVAGKSLLHLQCHFGMDTLSWARLGARVTGIDFSQVAIDQARRLAERCGMEANFVCSDLESPLNLGQFDIVYTSFGVLSWLRDLRAWGAQIARHLAPRGAFHLIEFHPVLGMFDSDGRNFAYPYFSHEKPIRSEETATYAGHLHEPLACYQWSHSMADILNSLIGAGLRLGHLHEFPYCFHRCYDFLVPSEPGRYVMRDHPGVPMLFAIKATW